MIFLLQQSDSGNIYGLPIGLMFFALIAVIIIAGMFSRNSRP